MRKLYERKSNCFCDQLESDMYFEAVKTYYREPQRPNRIISIPR